MTTYDHSLEGNAYPSLPLAQIDYAKYNKAKDIKMYMREFVSKIRQFQEVSAVPGNAVQEIALINSLKLLHAWCEPTQQHINESQVEDYKYHVRFIKDSFDRRIKDTNILLWAKKEDGEKVYFNFKALSRDQIDNLFGTAEHREFFLESYDGREAEPVPITDIK